MLELSRRHLRTAIWMALETDHPIRHRWLQEHPEATVVVEGHCDARGTATYNKELGAQRAEAARAFLIEQGISPDRIQVVSLGKERPDVLGWGASIWFYNRRVEFLPH